MDACISMRSTQRTSTLSCLLYTSVKAVLDALNEVAYRDDTQVVELQVRKQYSERPRLEICNERLEEFLSFEKGKDQEGRSKEYFAYQMFAGH